MEGEPATTPTTRRLPRSPRALQLIGVVIASVAISFCIKAIVDAWPEVRHSLAHAAVPWLVAAFAASAAAMVGLGLLWWRCLRLFGVEVRPAHAIAWHFGGELGKYVPGGVWAVLGRGELARQGAGINRGTAYATTLISYACMTVAAVLVCGFLAPAERSAGLSWQWALLVLLPLGIVAAHPAILGKAFAIGSRITRGGVDLEAPPWSAMLRLIAAAVPTWLLVGAAAAMVTQALGLGQSPPRVAFAAVAAWIVGFIAVPVPAGAGVREVVFVLLCGLATGPATTVAVIARALLLIVDGVAGMAGISYAGIASRRRAA